MYVYVYAYMDKWRKGSLPKRQSAEDGVIEVCFPSKWAWKARSQKFFLYIFMSSMDTGSFLSAQVFPGLMVYYQEEDIYGGNGILRADAWVFTLLPLCEILSRRKSYNDSQLGMSENEFADQNSSRTGPVRGLQTLVRAIVWFANCPWTNPTLLASSFWSRISKTWLQTGNSSRNPVFHEAFLTDWNLYFRSENLKLENAGCSLCLRGCNTKAGFSVRSMHTCFQHAGLYYLFLFCVWCE